MRGSNSVVGVWFFPLHNLNLPCKERWAESDKAVDTAATGLDKVVDDTGVAGPNVALVAGDLA